MAEKNVRVNGIDKKEMSEINNLFCNRYTSSEPVADAIARATGEHYAKMRHERTAQHKDFVELLTRQATRKNLVLSANGALEYASSGSALVDFNARATEFRNAAEMVIMEAAVKAYAEDPVQFIKLVFQTGDIRGGKGERHAFNTCMDWLVANHPLVADEVLELIPEYTRWDYLVRQTVSANPTIAEHATVIVVEQFRKDLQAVRYEKMKIQEKTEEISAKDTIEEIKNGIGMLKISLLGKWMPSLQTKKFFDNNIVRHMLKSLHMQEREYRKALSELRQYLNVVEKAMSAKDYDAIDMEKLSSKQQLRYAGFFKRVMAERRHEYIQAVLRGEKKMNASVLNPLEVLHEYAEGDFWRWVAYNEDLEAIWSMIPDKTSGNGNTLVIRDGSGSMTDPIGQGSSATMLEAASAMAIYCADHMTGDFHNKFLTFSSRPQLVDFSGCRTLADKINLLYSYDDCSNTDLEATFDLVLQTAVENGLSQEELPSYLMILSDMEFDKARGAYGYNAIISENGDRNTLFAHIRKNWEKAGYEMPTLVFWQLNGTRTIYPEVDAENGIIFLSGFSTAELENVMAGKFETVDEMEEELEVIDETTGMKKTVVQTRTVRRVLSPKEQLDLKLSDPRYDPVETVVKKGLEKEIA